MACYHHVAVLTQVMSSAKPGSMRRTGQMVQPTVQEGREPVSSPCPQQGDRLGSEVPPQPSSSFWTNDAVARRFSMSRRTVAGGLCPSARKRSAGDTTPFCRSSRPGFELSEPL